MENNGIYAPTFGETSKENKINSSKAIIFAALAAFAPIVFNVVKKFVLNVAGNNFDLGIYQKSGIDTLLSCAFNIFIAVLLLIGGKVTAGNLKGALRFMGIYALSTSITGVLRNIFQLVYTVLGKFISVSIITVFDVIRMLITAVLTVAVFLFLYKSFEERKIRTVTSGDFKKLKTRVVIVIIAILVITTSFGVIVPYVSLMSENLDVTLSLLVDITNRLISIVQEVVILVLFYILCMGVRKNKDDAIGCMAAYYLPTLFIYPVIQLILGATYMLTETGEVLTYINMATSIISAVAGFVLTFVFIKHFFTVKDFDFSAQGGSAFASSEGYTPQGYNPQSYNPQGYTSAGYNPQGYTPQGFNPQNNISSASPAAPEHPSWESTDNGKAPKA